jgi:RNA polymerase sigma factor (sigma-70 family)
LLPSPLSRRPADRLEIDYFRDLAVVRAFSVNLLPSSPTRIAMPMRIADDIYDQWLVLRAQDGDAATLAELVDRWQPRLLRHAIRLTGTSDGAADVTQLTWVAIIGGLHRLNDPACFRRWAFRIVGNKAADFVRSRQRDRTQTTSLLAEPADPCPGELLSTKEDEIALLQTTLRQLSPEHRAVLSLFYVENMSLIEIAEVVGAPLGTVKSRLHYARSRLKQNQEGNKS